MSFSRARIKDRREVLVRLEGPIEEPLGRQVNLQPQSGRQVQRVRLAQRGQLEWHPQIRDSRVQRGQRALLVSSEPLFHQERLGSQVQRDREIRQVQPALLDERGRRDRPGLPEQLRQREQPGTQDNSDRQVQQAPLEFKPVEVSLDRKEPEDRRDQPVQRDQRDQRVQAEPQIQSPDQLGQQELQVPKGFSDGRGLPDRRAELECLDVLEPRDPRD